MCLSQHTCTLNTVCLETHDIPVLFSAKAFYLSSNNSVKSSKRNFQHCSISFRPFTHLVFVAQYTALQTGLDNLTSSNFLRLLAVRLSTSCGILQLDFQLLVLNALAGKLEKRNILFHMVNCLFLRHFLHLSALCKGCTVQGLIIVS